MPAPIDDAAIDKALQHHARSEARYLDELMALVRIPSISFNEGYDPKVVHQSAEATCALMRRAGLHNVELLEAQTTHPYAYGEWLQAEGRPTLLLYAHHDVQPVGDPARWKSPPFEPTLREGPAAGGKRELRLYGRGAADDKAGILVHVAAIESWLQAHGSLPVNVKLLVEGEEEAGSANLGALLQKHRRKLAADAMVLTDTQNFDSGLPSITTALRGLITVQVEVSSIEQSLHSGMWGGPVPDAAMALSKILARLVDEQGRIAIPGIYDGVRPLTEAEKKSIAALPITDALFREQARLKQGVQLLGDRGPTEMTWRQPSLAVNAIQASSRAGAANKLVEVAWARVGIRTVPDMDNARVERLLTEALKRDPPWGVQVEVRSEGTGAWWYTDGAAPAFAAAVKALRDGYGQDPVFTGCGGSIPFVETFSTALGGIPALLIGVEDPYCNAHSEEESLHVGDFHRATRSAIRFYAEMVRAR
jgi:acetylornithine deacetylase/succinyl-diaminopimelate desuccinylase-like protein